MHKRPGEAAAGDLDWILARISFPANISIFLKQELWSISDEMGVEILKVYKLARKWCFWAIDIQFVSFWRGICAFYWSRVLCVKIAFWVEISERRWILMMSVHARREIVFIIKAAVTARGCCHHCGVVEQLQKAFPAIFWKSRVSRR